MFLYGSTILGQPGKIGNANMNRTLLSAFFILSPVLVVLLVFLTGECSGAFPVHCPGVIIQAGSVFLMSTKILSDKAKNKY